MADPKKTTGIPSLDQNAIDAVAADTKAKYRKIKGDLTFNEVAFGFADKAAIDSIAQTTMVFYQEALAGVRRKTSGILDMITQEKITYELAKANGGDVALKDLKAKVADIVQNAGVQSITDKAGRAWQLDTYASMVARTQFTNVVNTATKVQALKEGFDLVKVSSHGATDSCGEFEGKIYSLNGSTPGYPILSDVSVGTHLFAPNCKHTFTPVSQRRADELGASSKGEDIRYVDLRKFAVGEQKNQGSLVTQQRQLIRLFPNLSPAQQADVIALARQSKSPALAALEDLYRK